MYVSIGATDTYEGHINDQWRPVTLRYIEKIRTTAADCEAARPVRGVL
jgi:hypothetical protein